MSIGFDTRRFQHARPVYAVGFQDILADNVLGHGPEFLEELTLGVVEGRDIVNKGVKPHVYDIIPVKGHCNTPLKPGFRAGDTQILKGLFQKREHLVLISFRSDEIRIFLYVINKPVLIIAHTEKIVGFPDHLGGCLMIRTLAVDQFSFREKSFAPETVQPRIIAEVYVPLVINPVQDQLHGLLVCRVRGANKIAVADIQFGPQGSEKAAYSIDILLGRLPLFQRCLYYLVSVFISPGQEKGLRTGDQMKPV